MAAFARRQHPRVKNLVTIERYQCNTDGFPFHRKVKSNANCVVLTGFCRMCVQTPYVPVEGSFELVTFVLVLGGPLWFEFRQSALDKNVSSLVLHQRTLLWMSGGFNQRWTQASHFWHSKAFCVVLQCFLQ